MKDENKTININFRVSPKYKKWLDLLVEESPCKNISPYLNSQIYLRMRELLLDKAFHEGRDIAALQFGLSNRVRVAIKNPKDVKGLFGNKENEIKFLKTWYDGLANAYNKLLKEYNCDPDNPDETGIINSSVINSIPASLRTLNKDITDLILMWTYTKNSKGEIIAISTEGV
jgi:hypothetical protein